MNMIRTKKFGSPDDDYMTVESVGEDGAVVIRFAGGHQLRLAVPPGLLDHYRRLQAGGRST